MREEIELINKIIAESVMHGADIGGSYDSNEENSTKSITDWLKFKGIDNKYCVKYQEVRTPSRILKCRTAVWRILQICEKGGAENG
jgi:hypothetical protein